MAQEVRRERNILGFLLVLIVMTCCSSQVWAAMDYTTHQIEHDGIQREFHVYVPNKVSQRSRVPLVFVLHGGGGTGRGMARSRGTDNWIRRARKDGFIVVFPEGYGRRWNDGRKEIHRTLFGKQKYQANDVDFINTLIDHFLDEYPVDHMQIFATGISNGGFMSFRLALELSDRIRAIAPVTAQLSHAVMLMQPEYPISLMLINGTEDPLVPYEGGHVRIGARGRSRGEILSTEETVERFAKWNNCRGRPKVRWLPNKDPHDGTRIEEVHFDTCDADSEVILLTVEGGGHTWPGGVQYLPERRIGRVSRDINATDVIAGFFLSLDR